MNLMCMRKTMDEKLIKSATDKLNLMDIYLYSSKLNRFEDIFENDYPDEMLQLMKRKISAQLQESVEDESQKFLLVKITLGSRFVVKGDKDEIVPLSEVEACIAAKYKVKEPLSEDEVTHFSEYNSMHNVWPFWREHAFRVSREARLPIPNIPFYTNHESSDDKMD